MNFSVLQNGTLTTRFEADSVLAAITRFRDMALENASLSGPLGYFVCHIKNSVVEIVSDAEYWIQRTNYFRS